MLTGQVLDGRFLLQGVIGQGSFCTVYQATDQTRLKPVAVKVLKDCQMQSSFLVEVNAMKALRHSAGIPRIYAYGTEGKRRYLAMELMKTDVMKLFRASGPLHVCLLVQVAKETIQALAKVHAAGLLHLDLKPDNLALRLKHGQISCFLVDFGLSERYSLNGHHWKYSESYQFSGNATFASSNVLTGRRPSRRDDLESLIYVLVYLAHASLPWNLFDSACYSLRKAEIACEKEKLPSRNVCKGLPAAFAEILDLVKGLRFEEKPDYEEYVRMLERESVGKQWDEVQEWRKLLLLGKSAENQPALLRSLREQAETAEPVTAEQQRSMKRRLTKGLSPASALERHFAGRRSRRDSTLKSAPVVMTERVRNSIKLLRAKTLEQEPADWL